MQQGPIRIEISPRNHTATNKLEPKHSSMICTSFGMWSIGPAKPHQHPQGFTYPLHGQQGITHHVVPLFHVVSQPYLASPTHSRIYLFPPTPQWQQGMTCRTIPLLHVVFWPYRQWPHPHTQGFTRVIHSVSLQLGLLSPRQGNHQHHSTRAKPHQKLTSSMYLKYIVHF